MDVLWVARSFCPPLFSFLENVEFMNVKCPLIIEMVIRCKEDTTDFLPLGLAWGELSTPGKEREEERGGSVSNYWTPMIGISWSKPASLLNR